MKHFSPHSKLQRVLCRETNEPFVIAEIGQAHEGSLGQAISLIEAAAKSGADAVKFQTHFAAEESSQYDRFRVNVFPQDKTRFDYWSRMSFDDGQWKMLAEVCTENSVLFLSSPFSVLAFDLLEATKISAWKIASGEYRNLPMLERIRNTGKPVLISTGMASWTAIDEITEFFADQQQVIFQCTTQYPSQPETLGLNNIELISQRYPNGVTGLSDHSGQVYPSIAAYALGARVFEVHIAWSKDMFGPDSRASLVPEQLKELAESLASLERATNSPVDKDKFREQNMELVNLFGRGIYLRIDKEAGQKIEFADLAFLKPAFSLSADRYHEIVGSVLKKPAKAGDPLNWEDLTL